MGPGPLFEVPRIFWKSRELVVVAALNATGPDSEMPRFVSREVALHVQQPEVRGEVPGTAVRLFLEGELMKGGLRTSRDAGEAGREDMGSRREGVTMSWKRVVRGFVEQMCAGCSGASTEGTCLYHRGSRGPLLQTANHKRPTGSCLLVCGPRTCVARAAWRARRAGHEGGSWLARSLEAIRGGAGLAPGPSGTGTPTPLFAFLDHFIET